jgi:cation:H+ antiporter
MQSLIWTFPAIMLSSIMIGWAAELGAIHLSAGIALAILALLQTLPEFGVEAFISWSGNTHLMLANLTGSLRLFVGLGWPMVFFIHFFYSRRGQKPRYVQMPKTFAVEATFLALPIFHFFIISRRDRMTLVDGILLCSQYLLYLAYLNYQRLYHRGKAQATDHDEDDMAGIPAKVAAMKPTAQYFWTTAFFVVGGAMLCLSVHPFVEGLKGAAMSLGMSEFVFIQWIAPFASEFPEKVTAFGWARKASKVPMAVFNMVSSSVNQWTLLAGFVPIVYSMSLKKAAVIPFDHFQHTEVSLTIAQSILGVLCLADLRFNWYDAVILFVLWIVQFLVPETRTWMTAVYVALALAALGRIVLLGHKPKAWAEFYDLNRWIVKRWLRRVSS